ncbi:MAG: TnpV protein [Bifidobacterium choerinum]
METEADETYETAYDPEAAARRIGPWLPAEKGLHMQWHDPELRALYIRNLKRMHYRQEHVYPDLASIWDRPYHWPMPREGSIKWMRLQWLRDNHPVECREMIMADVMCDHLDEVEQRFRSRRTQIFEQLMEARHLVNRTDVMRAHPEITDEDRYYGMRQAQADAQWMAIHEVIESF